MDRFRRAPIVVLGLTLCTAALALAGQGKVVSAPLPPSEMEAFLLKGTILDVRDAGGGVTGSRRAKVTHGTMTHDVHIQSVDIMKPVFSAGEHTELNFKDSYRFNIAGYRLARLLGIHTVPMSVERSVNGKTAAVTWWVDDVQMDEKERLKRKTMGPNPLRTSHQIQLMRIWDELIQNRDRNQGNILWTNDWTMWLIDHTRAFRAGESLLKPNELIRVERTLFEKMKKLTEADVSKTMKGILTSREIRPMLKRRDALVKHFEKLIAERGEVAVFFTLSPAPAR